MSDTGLGIAPADQERIFDDVVDRFSKRAASLHRQGVRVVSLRRSNGRNVDPATDPPLQDGDTLVLSGRPETLALAEEILLKG